MAEFYGRLQGNRGEATRCGSKDSGIRVTAQTWTSVIQASQYMNGDEHRGRISVKAKNGGTVLSIALDADGLVRHFADPHVSKAVMALTDAANTLDAAIQASKALATTERAA